MKSIFLTGGTGFLGKALLEAIESDFDQIFLLSRRSEFDPSIVSLKSRYPKLILIKGDLSDPNLVAIADQLKEVTQALHLGGLYDFKASDSENFSTNITGTHNFLALCGALPNLERIGFASSVAVAGDFNGVFNEDMFNVGQKFSDSYAFSKFRAEGLIGGFEFPGEKVFFRYGVLVGDSRTGRVDKVDGPYYMIEALLGLKKKIRLIKYGLVTPLPFDEKGIIHMIPVDVSAQATAAVLRSEAHKGVSRNYHIVGRPLATKELIVRILRFVGLSENTYALKKGFLSKSILKRFHIPDSLLHYLYVRTRFDYSQFSRDFPEIVFPTFDQYEKAFFSVFDTREESK
ncbi:NAD-dependent epimerase/dehydratase family protein [bacterium]|nr:NAD-dependent epimerase/dehydratase family protein [bacterium]